MSEDLDDLEFPSDLQRQQVANRVAERLERIASLREEIALLTRSNVRDRFYIATHRLLPQEVLGEIFVHAAACGSGVWLAPIVISHVSRHWRNVVNRTPRAWSYICIRITPNSSYSELIKTWLELSGRSPLHLRFETPHWGTTTREPVRQTALGSYLASLQPHVARWHSVKILIGDAPHHSIWNLQLLLQQFNFDMPALRSFNLDTTRQLWQDYHILKGEVPLLTHLNIGHCRPSTTNHWLFRLEMLEITQATHSLYYMHGLLQACPLLTSLKLDVTIQEREVRGLDPIKLSRLQTLHLNDTIYLSFLRLPALISLNFVRTPLTGLQEGHKLLTSLRVMLEASGDMPLRELSLADVDIGRFNLSTREMPSLEVIRLTRCIIHPETLAQPSSHSIWSKLHTLELVSCDNIPESLFDLLKGNVQVSSLERVVFFDCYGVKPTMIDKFLAHGTSMRVVYSASTRKSPRTAPSVRSGPFTRAIVIPSNTIPLSLPPPWAASSS